MQKQTQFPDLVGHTFTKVERENLCKGDIDGDALIFRRNDGKIFAFLHLQDCCEHVCIDSIVGNLSDLENTPILEATKTCSGEESDYGSSTKTFYWFLTEKGSVTVRWYGSSNGFYSEGVDFEELNSNLGLSRKYHHY